MLVITFVERCEVILTDEFDFLDTNYNVPRIFFPGDEAEVDDIEALDDQTSHVAFMDGTVADIDTDCFVVTDTEQDDD